MLNNYMDTTKQRQSPVTCSCKVCGISFKKKASVVRQKKTKEFFCSHECHKQHKKVTGYTEVECSWCKAKFMKQNSERRKFCSHKCSCEYKKGLKPKHTCAECGTMIASMSPRCVECSRKFRASQFPDRVIGDVVYDDQGAFNAYAKIRGRARTIAKKAGWKVCRNCGYDKHIEVCHITPIKNFPKDAKESEVNALTNLVPLCPNCHWEFDKGLLKLK